MKNDSKEKGMVSQETIMLEFTPTKKKFKNYEIDFKLEEKSLNIIIKNENSLLVYESSFDEAFLIEKFKNSFEDNQKNVNILIICEKISEFISNGRINILEGKNQLKLILNIGTNSINLVIKISLIDLILSNKKIIKLYLIIIIIMIIFILLLVFFVAIIYFGKIKNIKESECDLSEINNTILSLKKNNNELNNNMTEINNTLISLKRDNNELNNNITEINNRLISLKPDYNELNNNITEINNTLISLKNDNNELNNNMTEINNTLISLKNENNELNNNMTEINNTLIFLINYNKKIEEKIDYINSLKFQIIKTNLTSINTFKKNITKLKQFPSGSIISILNSNSLLISDNNFNDLQIIQTEHLFDINNIDILDDNNFISCSDDSIIIWIKNNNQFEINETIKASNKIKQVIYKSVGNFISLSKNNSYIIEWEYNDYENKYINKKTISDEKYHLIYLLEDKNILISIGDEVYIFWDMSSYERIKSFNLTTTPNYGIFIERISEDSIIIGTLKEVNIISISVLEIMKKINNIKLTNNYKSIENKGLFITTNNTDLIVYRTDNFDIIQIIKDAHNNNKIEGLIYLNNGSIATTTGKEVKLWSF